MKEKSSYLVVILFTSLLLSGCALSDEDQIGTALAQTREVEGVMLTNSAATEAARITDTPAPTETPLPTPTSTPRPFTLADLQAINLEQSDLPSTYAPISFEEMEMSEDMIKAMFLEMGLSIGQLFAYFNEQDFQLIVGFTVFLPGTFERAGFDLDTRHPEQVLDVMELTDETGITNMGTISGEEIGDSSLVVFAEWEDEESPYTARMDMAIFRRNMVGVFLGKIYVAGEEVPPSIGDLASVLDAKVLGVTGVQSLTELVTDARAVCLVTDVGGIHDASFNQISWNGVMRAASAHGIEARFRESKTSRDYDEHIQAFIEEDCELIVTVSYLLADPTLKAAKVNPHMRFTIVDFPSELAVNNVVTQIYAVDQAAFLAGYLSAGMTETGTIATYGGLQIPGVTVFMDGFALGAKHYNREHGTSVRVLGWDERSQQGAFTGNFESLNDGYDLTIGFLDQGADIIFPVAGPVGLGSARAVNERGEGWILGVDLDWTISYPEYEDIILTSVLKKLDTVTYNVIESALAGEFEGGVYLGTLRNGGVGLAPFGAEVPNWLRDELVHVEFLIERGDLSTSP